MHIFVNVLSDHSASETRNFGLEVASGSTGVKTVKAKIERVEPSLPTCKQLLLFAGQQLEDGCSLEQYGIEDRSTLFLVLKPTGMAINIRMDVPDCRASTLSVDVEPTSTIADVKRHIDHIMRSRKQSLNIGYDIYFNGKLLEENSPTLKDCGVESQSTLQLSVTLHLCIEMAGKFANLSDISLSALSSDKIDIVKHKIIQAKQFPNQPSDYSLYYERIKLKDTATLAYYDIGDGSALQFCNSEYTGLSGSVRIAGMPEVVVAGRATHCISRCVRIMLCLPCLLIVHCIDVYRDHQNQHQGRETPTDLIIARSPTQEQAAASPHTLSVPISIVVRFPSGNSITLQALRVDTVQVVKSKIEAAEPSYPSRHQRLVVPGCCDDLLDGLPVYCVLQILNDHLVLRGKLISVEIKKDDGLPGLLILYLEYFDTVQSIKEGVYLDRNMRVPQSQQQLFLEEKLLDDSQTLSQCGIEDRSQIIVKVLAPSCQQLMNELLKDSVACRYDRFGIYLGLSPDTIECITMNHRDVYRCLINVINHWVNNYQVSWSAVTSALDQIDCRNMAETIRLKYNVVITT